MQPDIVAMLGLPSQAGQDARVGDVPHHGGAADHEKQQGSNCSLDDVRIIRELQGKRIVRA